VSALGRPELRPARVLGGPRYFVQLEPAGVPPAFSSATVDIDTLPPLGSGSRQILRRPNVLRRPGSSGSITPSLASRPSPVIHDWSFDRFDEIAYLVEKGSALTLARHRESETRLRLAPRNLAVAARFWCDILSQVRSCADQVSHERVSAPELMCPCALPLIVTPNFPAGLWKHRFDRQQIFLSVSA
jgi:hypothetical protein